MNVKNDSKKINSALLIEVSKLISTSSSSGQKITAILSLLSKWTKLYYGRILLPNNQTMNLEIAYSYGLPKDKIDAGQYSVSFSKGLTGYVWRSGQVSLVTNVVNEPVFLTRIAEPIEGSIDHVGFISVPIIVDGKTIGVFSAQRRANPRRRYSDDVDLLRVMATMIGPILQRMQNRAATISYNPHQLDRESGRWVELCESHGIIGSSKALLSAVKMIDKAKNSNAPVMILGESGTGKELFAQMAHKESKRNKKPFVCINCTSIPATLLESELFGHEKGSFTGAYQRQVGKIEQAHEGTLFLDEIGDMPLELQSKLLRVLQDKHVQPIGSRKSNYVDFRLITATHVNLSEAVMNGSFRLDLYYRLNVIPIVLPTLKERKNDITILAEFFLNHFCQVHDNNVSFTQGVYEELHQYAWPGNIRQLQNVIERAILQSENHWISTEQIKQSLQTESMVNPDSWDTKKNHQNTTFPGQNNRITTYETPTFTNRSYSYVNESESENILQTLKQTKGNQAQASRVLGMTVRQLRYRIKKLNLTNPYSTQNT